MLMVFARLMGLPTISPRGLHALVVARRVTPVDVSSPASYARAHVPGAIHLDPATFAAAELPAERATPLVF